MEHMNDGPAPVSGSAGQSSGGIFMGEYGDVGMGVGVGVGVGVSSMMALMTQHQDPNDGASFSAFQGQPECLLSAAAMFQNQSASASASASDHKLKQQQAFATSVKAEPGAHQLEFRSNSSSSRPSQDDQQGENSSSLPWMFAPASAADSDDAMKAKIVAHPQYPALLAAYIDCQKVGASPEIATRLEAIGEEYRGRQRRAATVVGMDPELDQFMEAYCEMLAKYHEELIKPFNEAMSFFKKVESQLSSITKGAVRISPPDADDKTEGGSSEEDGSCCETEQQEVLDQHVEERDLKDHLLRKFGGRLGPLKQEFMKKKKKGKLPKDARQKLLDWWNHHYKWPYPSVKILLLLPLQSQLKLEEPEKIALAESTGLDQKQINNWFINQRKRHWKPSEDMQFVVMDHAAHAHAHAHAAGAALYVEGPPPGYHHHHHHHHHHHLDC